MTDKYKEKQIEISQNIKLNSKKLKDDSAKYALNWKITYEERDYKFLSSYGTLLQETAKLSQASRYINLYRGFLRGLEYKQIERSTEIGNAPFEKGFLIIDQNADLDALKIWLNK